MTVQLDRPIEAVTEDAGEWQALHVYYTANSRPIVTQAIHPLVAELREHDLLERYFFINYWLGGPHVRLRLLPKNAAATEEVVRRAEAKLDEFLKVRPALYEVTNDHMLNYYDKLFEVEYADQDMSAHIGPDGRMLLRKNNSHRREQYEPEYDKYGGIAGVEVAEWHFEHSSDMVVEVDRTMNVHLRTVRLGVSLQLMTVMASNFLPDVESVERFFEGYKQFWQRSFDGSDFVTEKGYDKHYDAIGGKVGLRVQDIQQAVVAGDLDQLPDFLRRWSEHTQELARRMRQLSVEGKLVFGLRDGRKAVTDPDRALELLLTPFIHMTNNRLTTTIGDEAYLAHLIARVMREQPHVGVTP